MCAERAPNMQGPHFGRGPPPPMPPGPPPFPPGIGHFPVPPPPYFHSFEQPGQTPNYESHNFAHNSSFPGNTHQTSNYRPMHFDQYGYPPRHRPPLPRDSGEYFNAPSDPGQNSHIQHPVDAVVESNGNVSSPVVKDNEPWLHDWLKQRAGGKEGTKPEAQLTIPEAKALMKTAIGLLEELQRVKDEFNCDLAGETQKAAAALELQEKLNHIRRRLDEKDLGYRVRRASLKRARLKRQRKKLFDERQNVLERRKELHEKMDQRQASLLAEAMDKKRERDLKAAADATLSEVRKKLGEARKCKEILERLTKLRQVRKDAMERMGLYTAQDTDTNFISRRDKLGNVMEQQLKTYESEETTLKVMLEAEAEESMEKLKEETSARSDKQLGRHRTRLRRLLFGLHEIPESTDPIRPFWEYHTASDSNLQAFLTVRNQWDSCIVPTRTPGGSSVPPGWVVPSPPCDSVWRSALKQAPE